MYTPIEITIDLDNCWLFKHLKAERLGGDDVLQCFVSFCGDDSRDADVEQLIKELRSRTGGSVEYLVYYEKDYGESLADFMKDELNRAGACLMLFGPGYKKRIDQTNAKSGAYQEYDTIVTRLEDRSIYAKPKVIPILWAGDNFASAFPNYFLNQNPYVCKLNHFRAHGLTQGKPFIPESIIDQYAFELTKIANILQEHAETLLPEYTAAKKRRFARLLEPTAPHLDGTTERIEEVLKTIKYEHGNYNAETFRERFFTGTLFFRNLKNKNLGLISGRKGAGKTTLVQIRELEADNDEYYPAIDIQVDGWNLHYLIQNNSFKQADGDFEYADTEAKFFDYVWACFVGLCIANSLARHSQQDIDVVRGLVGSPTLADEFQTLVLGSDNTSSNFYASLFQLAVNTAKLFIQSVVDNARTSSDNEFRLDVISGLSVQRFLYAVFGDKFYNLRTAIYRSGNRRFLFCFDRFDNEIQRYRKEGIERDQSVRQARASREVKWLSSLTMFVERARRPDRLSSDREVYEFFSVVKFVVVFPYDRTVEIRGDLRDAVVVEAIQELSWQAPELLTMLRKRLQEIYYITDQQIEKRASDHPRDRWLRCKNLACPDLPDETIVLAAGKEFKIDVFLNVLRHSFFRPRDVLIYYASILSDYDAMKAKHRHMDANAIKNIISAETRTVVNFEFVGELKDTWTNIEEVLARFKGIDQILSSRDLEAILHRIDFLFYHEASAIRDLDKKIDFLYRIGFLGFKTPKAVGRRRDQDDFSFAFLDPQLSVDFSIERVRERLTFAIHPIFIESLFLRTNGDEPVLNLTWEKIKAHDRLT